MKLSLQLDPDPFNLLCQLVEQDTVSWAIGTFGALAEFSYDASDHPVMERTQNFVSLKTHLGGLRIEHHPDLKLVPYEGLSKLENAWTQGVLICLPEQEAQLECRFGLTNIGPDPEALTTQTAGETLFDLGLGVIHLNACIRAGNKDLLEHLKKQAGKKLFDPTSKLAPKLVATSPTRVFITRCGRIEINQDIPDMDGETPLGAPYAYL